MSERLTEEQGPIGLPPTKRVVPDRASPERVTPASRPTLLRYPSPPLFIGERRRRRPEPAPVMVWAILAILALFAVLCWR